MLLNQFKTGSRTTLLCGGSRDGFVVRKARCFARSDSLQVHATASEGAGWLESTSSSKTAGGEAAQVGRSVKQRELHGNENEMVEYKGTAVIMKKLKLLDLVDSVADLQDDASEMFLGKHVSVQLLSNEIDPKTGKALVSSEVIIERWVNTFVVDALAAKDHTFHLKFAVPRSFGIPGAIIVKNNHPNEFLLVLFSLGLPDSSTVHFITNSWVYNTSNSEGRFFFHNKAYLPTDTPAALKELREKELQDLRGNGKGERKEHERIYDYDIYNDLGKPDDDPKHTRPTLGGNSKYPFPRRMRTGRPPTKTSPMFESRAKDGFYIPRDEVFDRVKFSDNKADLARAVGHAIPTKVGAILSNKTDFESVEAVKSLFAPKGKDLGGLNNVLPGKADLPQSEQNPLVFLQEFTNPDGKKNDLTHFPLPRILHVDDKAWQSNEEFARQFLAGSNPIYIKLVTEFPLKSSLNPDEYGDPVSAISSTHIDGHLEGLSIQQAVSEKKLFVVDYHDIYFPFVERINAQKDSKTYATRALFFLSSDETLKVLALELVLPPKTPGGAKTSRVFTPPADSSKTDYVWELAKAHVMSNDMAVHQVLSHFTRCHTVTEPVIIATHRQLSKLHPIHQLMAPHLKHTLQINMTARLKLLPAEGILEQIYTPRRYVVRMAAADYRDNWTFEKQALPNDLISRGMAVPDSSAEHGVRLVVQDYPYAADGIELWGAMKSWNQEYIDIYYKDDSAVQSDAELQNWWTEYRTVGHADKKDAPGWPVLDSKKNLAEILTTLQWIPTCMHAPLNFGLFHYAGFMPSHPAMTRRLIPDEGSQEWDELQSNPEKFHMSVISDMDSATTAMAVFEVVAAHAPNEEYIDERPPNWTENEKAMAAFKRHSDKLSDIDKLIQARNVDSKLKNRAGVVQMPFELLRPHSASGVTGMGIPNSITV